MKKKSILTLLTLTAMLAVGCDNGNGGHKHKWSEPSYSWNADYTRCTASRYCLSNRSHVEKETVNSTYVVVTPSTEEDEGTGLYTAQFSKKVFNTQNQQVSIPIIGDVDSFESAVNSINVDHNYTVSLVNQFEGESSPFVSFNYYNIDDNALFSDMYGYYSGYIKQKDQGIVTFKMPLDSSGLILDYFVLTNLERGVSDFFDADIEYLIGLEQLFKCDFRYSASKGAYVCSDYLGLAIIATMAFGFSTEASCIAPENFIAYFINGNLYINAVFEVRYFDVKEIITNANVTLTVNNFKKTHNTKIESYVANPDYTFEDPTEWDNGIKELFSERYNNYMPPFIKDLSFSWHYYPAWNEGKAAIALDDIYGGNLIDQYVEILLENDFHRVSNPGYVEYALKTEDETLEHTYSIKMKYHPADELDKDGTPYGYLYPNGKTTFIFLHKSITKSTIVTIDLLNEYISNSVIGEYFPSFALPGDVRVYNFADKTDSEASTYAVKYGGRDGSGSAYFYIYPQSKEEAITFFEKLKSDLALIGLDTVQSMLGEAWISDDYSSVVRITDPNSIDSWDSSTRLSVKIDITKTTLESWENPSA